MPELPDVEAQRLVAQRHALGRRVRSVACRDPQVLRGTTPQGLGRALSGARFTAAERTGKWLCLVTDAASDVLVHFGMTGALHWHQGDEEPCDRDLLRFHLDGGVLAYHVTRKLGGVWLVRDEDERREVTGPLGVDALEVDEEELRAALGGSRAALKSALMDQTRIAGVGNLLADEVCWQAMVHPATPCAALPDDRWAALADALDEVLEAGVEAGQVPTAEGSLTAARDEDDPRCPRCGTALEAGTIAGRTTRWCPQEQPAPR